MTQNFGMRSILVLSSALVIGAISGWYVGSAFGLYGDDWFSEPEDSFELLVAICGALCGALLTYVSTKGVAWRSVGIFAGGCFALAIIGYSQYSIGLPTGGQSPLVYLREFVSQTFAIWISPVTGAASVALIRLVLR